jgi:hypothetical protein
LNHKSTRIAEVAIAAAGCALVAGALLANQAWLDRHFLPSFFITRHSYVLRERAARTGAAALGAVLAFVLRPRLARFVSHHPGDVFRMAVAAALALGASELVLARVHLRPVEWLEPDEEPLRRADPRLGWSIVPARTGHSTVGGRAIEYTFDPLGYRVRRLDEPVDPARPSIVFIGESVMLGYDLNWDETIPAQVGAALAVQPANLAVNGYGSDQALLRLETELPRFRRPVAVVALFMTSLFARNLDDDRPHLGPGLVWLPARRYSRLGWLAKFFVPYRSTGAVESGIGVTREVLRATVDLAKTRGAVPLIVVPQFGVEDDVERSLRRRILDEAGLPYVFATIDPAWHVQGDEHPDARGTRAIAAAIAARLKDGYAHRSSSSSLLNPGPKAAASP